MNRVTLIGRLGKDAELRKTQTGESVSSFSLATSEKWLDKEGQKKESTDWHKVVLWGKRADSLTQYLTKGKEIAVEGKISYRKWTDSNGIEKWQTDIVASQIQLLGSSKQNQDQGPAQQTPPPAAQGNFSDNDIPF